MIQTNICYIGGGSADWAMKLMRDLALDGGLTGSLRLYDIDREAAEVNQKIGQMLFRNPESRTTFDITVEDTPGAALDGAEIVILSIEPGSTEFRYADLEIPAAYGILQSVGDTTGPGGILRSWRAVPIFLDYAELIRRYAPEAWVVNYTNPMTLCTRALYHCFPEIKAVGCCHEVPQLQRDLATFVSDRKGLPVVNPEDIRIDVTGINHFTFATAIEYDNFDVMAELRRYSMSAESFSNLSAAAAERRHNESWFESDHRIALDFLRRFGAYGMAGDRHLAEFVPWYLSSEEELETFGVIKTPYQWRLRRSLERKNRNPEQESSELEASGEEGVQMIRSLLGDSSFRTNVNIPNRGQIPWIPDGHPVETYAMIKPGAINPETPQPPPLSIQCFVKRVVDVQIQTFNACVERDSKMLLQAVLMDPLVQIPVRSAEKMLYEMLEYIDGGN